MMHANKSNIPSFIHHLSRPAAPPSYRLTPCPHELVRRSDDFYDIFLTSDALNSPEYQELVKRRKLAKLSDEQEVEEESAACQMHCSPDDADTSDSKDLDLSQQMGGRHAAEMLKVAPYTSMECSKITKEVPPSSSENNDLKKESSDNLQTRSGRSLGSHQELGLEDNNIPLTVACWEQSDSRDAVASVDAPAQSASALSMALARRKHQLSRINQSPSEGYCALSSHHSDTNQKPVKLFPTSSTRQNNLPVGGEAGRSSWKLFLEKFMKSKNKRRDSGYDDEDMDRFTEAPEVLVNRFTMRPKSGVLLPHSGIENGSSHHLLKARAHTRLSAHTPSEPSPAESLTGFPAKRFSSASGPPPCSLGRVSHTQVFARIDELNEDNISVQSADSYQSISDEIVLNHTTPSTNQILKTDHTTSYSTNEVSRKTRPNTARHLLTSAGGRC